MDHVLIAYDPHLISWWWFIVPIALLIIGAMAYYRASAQDNALLMHGATLGCCICSIAVIAGVIFIPLQHNTTTNARHPSTERVADAFGLTPTDDTGINFADAHNTRYTDCYTRSHLVSPTQISAQLFCLKGGQSITMHTSSR